MFYNNEYGAIILADKHCTPGTLCGYDFLRFWNVLYSNKEIFPEFILKPENSLSFTNQDKSKYLEWAVKGSEALTYDLYVDNSIVQSTQIPDTNTIKYQVDTSSTGVKNIYIEIITASGLVNYQNVTLTIEKKNNPFFPISGFTIQNLGVILPVLAIYLVIRTKSKI